VGWSERHEGDVPGLTAQQPLIAVPRSTLVRTSDQLHTKDPKRPSGFDFADFLSPYPASKGPIAARSFFMTQATFCNVLEHPFIIQRAIQRKLTDFLKIFTVSGILEIFTRIMGKPTQQNGKKFRKSADMQ